MEAIDTSATSISKTEKIIEECSFGIHDISRTELDANHGLPRFNMPFELGLFLGAKRFGDAKPNRKRCLVMDVESFRFQKFLSDIAGQDIAAHGGDIQTLIDKVWAFLNSADKGDLLPSGLAIFDEYKLFCDQLPAICSQLKQQPDALEYKDFIWIATDYIARSHPN